MCILQSRDSESTRQSVSVLESGYIPIFITGFARSGTTWVNQLLRDYFDIGLVNEGQFIITYGRCLKRYGDLHEKINFERLVGHLSRDNFFSILKNNYSISIEWNKVRGVEPQFSEIVREILKQIARGLGKSKIGSKYPVFGRHLDLVTSLFPDCRVIHIIRDGRDCALSHKSLTWGHQNAYAAAIHWHRYLQTIQRQSANMSNRFLEIRYEDLLLTPEITLSRLGKFITGADNSVIARQISADCNLPNPQRTARWRKEMSAHDRATFESVAGDMLEAYSYPLTGTYRLISPAFGIAARIHDRMLRELWNLYRKIFRLKSGRKPW